MLMKSICGILLAASTTLVQAEPARWDFTWGGFYDYMQNRFIDTLVHGSFEGIDANGNAILEASELTTFRVDGRELLGCTTLAPSPCGVSAFSYAFNGDLSFRANHISYTDYGGSDWYWSEVRYDTGSGVAFITRAQQHYEESGWMTTPQTLLTMSPVPEPHTYIMLGAGLLLLPLLAGRRNWPGQRSKMQPT
ncbi:PEP-CTERM sorting domain-containing protein [Pseudoduganella sp. R-43]|uniref:PEP-CTERM sorting domain-containing protein n=1 Tax=Pseudoduganella sp. R-43 TaxID=3404063 RepID=UPI003CEFAD6D